MHSADSPRPSIAAEAAEPLPPAGPRLVDPEGLHAFILHEDPDLAEGLSPADRRLATQLFRAPVIRTGRLRWQPPKLDPATAYGLLVLDGLLCRRTTVGPGIATELVGAGDVLRPWQEPYPWSAIGPEIDWRVLQPARLAVLDERITRLIGRRPELMVAFSNRLLRRLRSAECQLAIASMPRIDDRLRATLWHLASHWGRVTPEGVRVPFRLTHDVLAEIIGARRPSVTVGLRVLRERGQVICDAEGRYTVTGEPGDWPGAARGSRSAARGRRGHRVGRP